MISLQKILEHRSINEKKLFEKCQISIYEIYNDKKKPLIVSNLTKPLAKVENAWKTIDHTEKTKIVGMLNKINENNYDKLLESFKETEYKSDDIIDMIFRKAVSEPFYGHIYARLCDDLDLKELINSKCLEQFKKHKHKNLSNFVSQLYKRNIIGDLQIFVDIITEELDEKNLEILVEIIKTVGSSNEEFTEIIKYLKSIKDDFKSRHRFMIMDL